MGTHHMFSDAYLEAAMWAEQPDGEEGERWYAANLAPETRERLLSDAVTFYNENTADIEAYGEVDAGHDFWLTRRGHGAGFWEHDTPEAARLDAAAKAAGDCELYVGDDGMVYAA